MVAPWLRSTIARLLCPFPQSPVTACTGRANPRLERGTSVTTCRQGHSTTTPICCRLDGRPSWRQGSRMGCRQTPERGDIRHKRLSYSSRGRARCARWLLPNDLTLIGSVAAKPAVRAPSRDKKSSTPSAAEAAAAAEADAFRGVHLNPNAHHWDEVSQAFELFMRRLKWDRRWKRATMIS